MKMKKKLLVAASILGGLAVIAGIAMVVMIGPKNVIGMLRYDIRKEGKYKVGDRAPDVEVVSLEGRHVHLVESFGTKPTVIIFGSFT